MSEQCPNCLSVRIGKNNYGKKTAGVVGASAGTYGGFAAATAGAKAGAALGIVGGPVGATAVVLAVLLSVRCLAAQPVLPLV